MNIMLNVNNDMNDKDYKDTVAETTKEVYEDLAKPTAIATGELLTLIPRTIRACLSGIEKWILNKEYSVKETQRLLEMKLANVSPDKIEMPEAYIAVPTINAISYTFSSSELLDMYANLLATSMINDSKWEVHPSFVEIIKQLCPDEAKILKKLSLHNGENEFPLLSLGMRRVDNILDGNYENEHYIKIRNFSNIGDDVCEMPRKIMMYIDNLSRLQLIEVVENETVTGFNYSKLSNHVFIKEYQENNQLYFGFEWEIKENMFKITQLGLDFIKVCVSGELIK